MEGKRAKYTLIAGIIVLVLVLIGLSYAYITFQVRGENIQTITIGELSVILDDKTSDGINIPSSGSLSDEEGLTTKGYHFSLLNKANDSASYKVYLDDVELDTGDIRLDDRYLKYSLDKNERKGAAKFLTATGTNPNRILEIGNLAGRSQVDYTLRVWITNDVDGAISNQVFKAKIRVEVDKASVGADTLLANYTNDASIIDYNNTTELEKTKMFVFPHTAGAQQTGWSEEELTDYRYIGASPNNYVQFNDEIWRIIGVFTVDDGTGKREKRIKIMRDEFLTPYLRWDSTTVEHNYGKNRWSDSQLQKLLNPGYESESNGGSLYYNQGKGSCYGSQTQDSTANGTASCDYSTTGLSTTAKKMIDDATWYLGSPTSSEKGAEYLYEKERGTEVNDSSDYPRETSWVGKVALMYISDYSYTFGFGIDDGCYTNPYECHQGNPLSSWIYTGSDEWSLTPSYLTYYAFRINRTGRVYADAGVNYAANVRPVVYLKSDIIITSGTGRSDDPFILG